MKQTLFRMVGMGDTNRLRAPPPRHASWHVFDAVYGENAGKLGVSNCFGAPLDPGEVQYMSVAEFEATLPMLASDIQACLAEIVHDEVVLWVGRPGKSNFWFTLKMWPLLRSVVHRVACDGGNRVSPQVHGARTVHLFLDDAIFSGEQLAGKICYTLTNPPAVGRTKAEGARRHRITEDGTIVIVGTMVASKRGIIHVEEEINKYDIGTLVVSCARLMRADHHFYFGYKLADALSIPDRPVVLALIPRGGSSWPEYTRTTYTLDGKELDPDRYLADRRFIWF